MISQHSLPRAVRQVRNDDQAVVRKSGSLHALSRRGQSSSKCVSAMGVLVRKVHSKASDTLKNNEIEND